MKHLKLFDTIQSYNTYKSSGQLALPNVSLCEDQQGIFYIPQPYDTEIDYLESSGYAHIDTGIIFSSNFDIECEFAFTNITKENQGIYGCFYTAQSAHKFGAWVGNQKEYNFSYFVTDGGDYTSLLAPDTSKHLLIDHKTSTLSNNYITLDGSVILSNYGNTLPNLKFYIFKYYRPNEPTLQEKESFIGRIYSFVYKVQGEKVLDLIPVRVGQVGYMYDKVSGQLFGNSGAGNFILGPDK